MVIAGKAFRPTSFLIEAKAEPNPKNFVPVVDWDKKCVWLWVRHPGGKVIGPVAISHDRVSKYAGKLGWSASIMPTSGQIDPAAYSGPKDIYPLTWKPGMPLPEGPPKTGALLVKYQPPILPQPEKEKEGVPKLPPEFTLTGKIDAHGFPTVEDLGSGEIFSIIPDGRFGKWEEDEGVYYIVKKEEGEWDVHLDSPVYTPSELNPKEAPEPVKPPEVVPPKEEPKFAPPKAKPSTEKPKSEKVISPDPEPAPHLTKYVGKVDPNGLPLVDEVFEEDGGDEEVVKNLTLLPDDRVARWWPKYGYYLIYDYHPQHGFMYSKTGETVYLPEIKKLMAALSLTVKNARYHKVAYVGSEPEQTPSYQTPPLPNNCELISDKDLNGFPMVQTLPPDPDDDKYKLTLLPNSRLAKWDKKAKKYLLWEWRSILGFYNYFPTHPSEYMALKEVQKLQAQLATPTPTPASPPPKPKVTPVSVSTGELVPTGEKDDHGYPLAKYGTSKYVQLPDGKVGKWSNPNGAYILHVFDPDSNMYYSAMKLWTPPNKHAAGPLKALTDDVLLAQLTDTVGTTVLVAPPPLGKYVVQVGPDKYEKYIVNTAKGNIFEPTGEYFEKAGIYMLSQLSPYSVFVPIGEVDINGLPKYKIKSGSVDTGGILTLLPNGFWAIWSPVSKFYVTMDYDPEKGIVASDPMKYFNLDDIKAMHIKNATEGEESEFDPAVSTTVMSPKDKYLAPIGDVDPHGFPLYKTTNPEQNAVVSILPTGDVAVYQQPIGVYSKLYFNIQSEKWFKVVPFEFIYPADLKPESGGALKPEIKPEPKPEAPPAPAAVVPEEKMPNPDDLVDLGSMGLKGAGQKTVLEDPDTGKRYIFKLAVPKTGVKRTEAFRVASQEGFSAIASVVRPDAYVPVESKKHKGRLGALQPVIELDSTNPDLSGLAPEKLTSQQKADVASEHLLDWVMSQHDSFAANLVISKEGRVIGIDKEQGWKYVEHPTQPDRLATDYKPNTVLHGEKEPYYNEFWKAFAKGTMDFDPTLMVKPLERLEQMPPEKLESALNAYLNTLSEMSGATKTYERYAFIKKMLSRKATLRADFEKFITEQYQQRTGEAGKFTFKGGWVAQGEEGKEVWQDVKATVREWAIKELGPNALKPHKHYPELMLVRVEKMHPITKVQEFLSDMGVEPVKEAPDGTLISENPVFGSNYNSVIVSSEEMDREVTKKVQITKEPGEKYADYIGIPTYHSSALAPTEAPGNVEDLAKAHEMKLGPLGKNFTLDADAVEQQTASVQRMIDVEGNTYYIVHFKLRKPYWEGLSDKGSSGYYTWPLGAYDPNKDALVLSSYQGGAFSQPARMFSFPGGDEMAVLVDAAQWAFKGSVYATIREGVDKVKTVLSRMMKEVGLDEKVMKNPTSEDKQVYNMAQALWAMAPTKHEKLKPEDFNVETLKSKLSGVLTKKQIDSIRQVRGTVGRGSPIIPGLWKTLGGGTPENPVVRFLFWTVDVGSVTKILKSAATGIHERLRLGLGTGIGTSETVDMRTGGADTTTVRLATRGSENRGVSHIGSVSRAVKLILAPEILDRLDTHISVQTSSLSGDSYGCTNPDDSGHGSKFKARRGLDKDVKRFDENGYHHGGSTEVVIRRGVPPDMIKRICTSNEKDRKEILEACANAGILEHNGCPIEDFVVVEDNQGAIHKKYLKPLGY